MKLFFILLTGLVFGMTALADGSLPSNCTPAKDSCDYYLCKARELNCTSTDYPVKFGYKLCQRYLQDQHTAPRAFETWFPAVRECLQKKFDALQLHSCQNIDETAFSTHVDCYIQTGFCQLSTSDKAWLVVETSWQMFDPLAMQTALQVQHACDQQQH